VRAVTTLEAPPEISISRSATCGSGLASRSRHPTIVLLLFTPEEQLAYGDELGGELRALVGPK
jgi:hypothetical protein